MLGNESLVYVIVAMIVIMILEYNALIVVNVQHIKLVNTRRSAFS